MNFFLKFFFLFSFFLAKRQNIFEKLKKFRNIGKVQNKMKKTGEK